MKYVIVIGNLVRVIGPFATRADAKAYIEARINTVPQWRGYTTEVVPLTEPEALP